MPFLEKGSAKIFYEIEGDALAPCITLINGYSRSSSDFRAMARFLVERGMRILRSDNRGCGKTETPGVFTRDEMIADIRDIWDAEGISRSHVLGISYGGVLSQLLANQFPGRVRSLILVSTTPSSFFFGVDNRLSSQGPEEINNNLARYFSPHFAKKNPTLFKAMIKETSKVFLDPKTRAQATLQREALHKFDFTALLHSLSIPTLILHGEDDQVISSDAAEVMHRAIRGSELQVFSQVGHLFLVESPTLFYDAVWKFLERNA